MSTININVSKTDMGLDQVDNTSDLNKPISTATQTALDNIDLQSVTDLGNTTTDNIAFTGAVGVLFDNTSTLRKGTIDAGYGGAKGIAQVCSVGYELKWEAGRLYIMGDGGTTIREVSHNFTTTPSATDDNTKGFIVGSRWILDNGDLYVCTDVTTATAVWVLQTIDASPTDGSTKAVSSNGVFDALALKQDTLSGGTTNRLTKWSSSSAITSSLIQDNGTTLSIGTTPVANNLFKISSNATDTTLVSENSQASGVGISGSSSGSNGVGGSFTSTSVTGVKIGVNASATGAGGTNKGAVFGATNGATNYSIQLTDGTEGSGKFLKSVTANGEANWASIANTDVSGLGSLATQSGTFSGTSSGTNTGDQVISDATITTTDITTNNFTTAKHGFVPKGTNVGNFLKDDGTWGTPASGGSGIWGISDSSGVYTYYATWALAVAAAVSGKVIELFADITESTNTYTLKNGVNVNGNGHTITFSNAGNGFDDNNVACTVIFSNINLVKTTASAIIQCFSVSSNIGGYSAFLNVNNAGAWGFYGSGSIWGLSTTGSGLNVLTRAGTTLNISNCYIFGSVNANNGTVLISNCYIKGSGELVSGSPSMNNCTLIATSGVAYTGNNKNITNCSIVSMTSNVISGGGIFENCYIYSAAERPISADSNSQFHNCYIESATLYINQFNTSANYYNCTLKVKLSFLFYGGTQKLYNCTLINEWNTTGVYIFRDCVNNVEVNNYIQVANSGTIINYTASTQTVYMYGNAIKGTSTINSAGITNAQTNLVDLQGNVILN